MSEHTFKWGVNSWLFLFKAYISWPCNFYEWTELSLWLMEAFMRMLLMDYMEGVVSKLGELSEDISSRVDLKPLLLLFLSVSQNISIQRTSRCLVVLQPLTLRQQILEVYSQSCHSLSHNFCFSLLWCQCQSGLLKTASSVDVVLEASVQRRYWPSILPVFCITACVNMAKHVWVLFSEGFVDS